MCVQIFASDIRIYQNASFNYYDTHPIALFAILKNLAIISGLTVDWSLFSNLLHTQNIWQSTL